MLSRYGHKDIVEKDLSEEQYKEGIYPIVRNQFQEENTSGNDEPIIALEALVEIREAIEYREAVMLSVQ